MKPGIYKHFKGNRYLVTGTNFDMTNRSGSEPRKMVEYTSLTNGKKFSREEKEFSELIDMRTGKKLDFTYAGGMIVNRFKLIEET